MKNLEPNFLPGEKREIDAEQLLKSVEMQLAKRRQPRRGGSDSRTAFRVGSLVIIVAATIIALSLLQWIVSGMAHPAHLESASVEEAAKK